MDWNMENNNTRVIFIEDIIVENNKLKEENSKEIFVNQEATKYVNLLL